MSGTVKNNDLGNNYFRFGFDFGNYNYLCKHLLSQKNLRIFKGIMQYLRRYDSWKIADFTITEDTLDGKINIKLKRLYEILNGKKEQSKRDKEKIQSLISDISHQVKTPAANLKMYMQILSHRDMDKEKRREFLELSFAQAEKLEFLMQVLIKMSRLETGIISFKKEKVPVTEIFFEGLAQIARGGK